MTPTFSPPGPGFWELDRSHFDGGATPLMQWLATEATEAAYRKAWPMLGMPAETISLRFVNGFCYTRVRPLVNPDKPSSRTPPSFVLKVASRVHPEFRRRNAAAGRSLADPPAPRVIEEWRRRLRPRLVEMNRTFQGVDLGGASDDQLQRHVNDLVAHVRTNFEEHHRLHCYDLGPIGQLLTVCKSFGIPGSEAVQLLAGASPSTAAPRRRAAEIRMLIDQAIDAGGDEPATLEKARALSPEIDRAIDDYLERYGGVVYSGYDLDSPTLLESPDLLLQSILGTDLHSLDVAEQRARVAAEEAASRLRERVPDEEREAFDTLVAGARDAMDLRDDNGPVTVEWPMGLLRLALLEAGRRLEANGGVMNAHHVVELEPDELPSLFDAARRPSGEVLAARAEQRAGLKRLDPPRSLGDPEPTPPLDVLPPSLATLVSMVETLLEELGMANQADRLPADGQLTGYGVGGETIRGRARVAETAQEAFAGIDDGGILVTRATSPAYNLVLDLVDGLVTAEGGPVSHAAVLSRELGLTAVIGARGAMESINDGDVIEIDPLAGRVRVVERMS